MNVPLTNCLYFATVNSTFGIASFVFFFVINLSAVALFKLVKSSDSSNALS